MRHWAVGWIAGLGLMAIGPGFAQDRDQDLGPPPGSTVLRPDATLAPPPGHPGSSLPELPRPGGADALPSGLPPLWLVPLPDAADQAADQAWLDAGLEARFAAPRPPSRRFERDLAPLAAGEPWQALQRRVEGMLGP